jgi:DNA-binding NarL/FixJ family response regulator
MFKALIVEDHPVFRQSLHHVLSSRFPALSLAEADSGKTALAQVRDFEPDLVFMDINLPDDNGLALTRIIKAGNAATTVFVITAYDLPEYRQAAMEAGANQFIPKSTLSEDAVLRLVESLMAEFSSRNSHRRTAS